MQRMPDRELGGILSPLGVVLLFVSSELIVPQSVCLADWKRGLSRTFAAVIAIGLLANAVSAGMLPPAKFIGSGSGSTAHLSAEAIFNWSGSTLTILLSNTSTATPAPSSILTAIFFDVDPNQPNLAEADPFATGAAGSVLWTGTTSTSAAGQNFTSQTKKSKDDGVYGGWQYKTAGATGEHGGSTAGFGIFDGNEVFRWDYGLVKAGYNPAVDGNSAMPASPLISNSILLTLTGLSVPPDGITISNVRFQFGTNLSEPSLEGVYILGLSDSTVVSTPVPEPASLALAGFAGLGLVLGAVRRRHS
jgi:hypothetical protein